MLKEFMQMEYYFCGRSQDNSVSMEMGYGPDGWGTIPRRDKRFCFSP
jgi:hypothetical protein